MRDSQIWLTCNNEPKEEVMHRWKLFFPIRKIAHLSLDEFFEQWPILKTQAAVDLVKKHVLNFEIYCFWLIKFL